MEKIIFDEKQMRAIMEVLFNHEDGDRARYVCDADGNYCRSECVHSAAERIRKFFSFPQE